MSELKVQNFGPIREGYTKNDGYIPFGKVVVLCGPQATGKSCVAKLYSTFSWLEKALIRGDFSEKYLTSYNRFAKTFCAYQNIQNYFKKDTFLHYKGSAYEMRYEAAKLKVTALNISQYQRPQIMYVPAERNILSVIENAENVKGLPPTLSTLLDVSTSACKNMKGNTLLPINGASFRYDKLNKRAWIETMDYAVRLSETSSGMQSVTPLFIVLDYLARNIGISEDYRSQREREEFRRRIEPLLKDDTLDTETRRMLVAQYADTSNKRLLSIIEEPEQNLYPKSQRQILNFLLALNAEQGNQLVLTTHSPYIINYLSLAIKAKEIWQGIDPEKYIELERIVPQSAAVDGNEVSVYEIDEGGGIHELAKYDGMPSDENQLNTYMDECNVLFSKLLQLGEWVK